MSSLTFFLGLYKIFDEILVNAADNKQRDSKMSKIDIDINPETNTISVYNNGLGIPVVMHKDENMYVPTMIFGHLLTSSNYSDEEQKVTGGRNGYGAKLCNIFSDKFTVETASRQYKKTFCQTWAKNMSKTEEPVISKYLGEDYTKITFSPDLTKFKMTHLDDDIVQLMRRRAYDIAASTRGVAVTLNSVRLPIKNFKDYIDLYIKTKEEEEIGTTKVIYETPTERWEIAATISDRGFQQVSFVNSIATMKGGRHVDYIVDMIVKQLIDIVKKKNKGGVAIKPFQVKNHLWVFINCLIVNPTFDSQTKENMTLQAKNFGSKCSLSDKFISNISKSGIVEAVLSWAKFKEQNELSKTSGKKHSKIKGIPKLEDANDAGTRNAHNCTLILTEGESAKTFALSGLGIVGRDLYGVFPLRGKLLNVREATHKQILENAEINALIKIIGLQYKTKYLSMDDLKKLRYGKIMIMTDQDQDGSHIKGLIINFVHTNWPELLRLPFVEEFISPIVKVTKKDISLSFFSLPEFEEWQTNTHDSTKYKVKYYKGLGTSTAAEAKEYFKDMNRHRITFKYEGVQDDESIVMAFSKKTIEQRKVWLTKHMEECKERKLLGLPERYLYEKTTKQISYHDFINLELILFSNADNVRSIPSLVDGMKPGQRKVLFTCIKRNDKHEVKVAQLAGSVGEKSAYHHGEASLCSTIVGLAQNFVGSNNINVLMPNGQFGSRLSGGKDAASARYIFTMMSPLTRLIFHPDDDPILNYLLDDNKRVEPEYYVPIIPMLLVNGAEGIGTGWSTKIPNFNPRDLIKNLRLLIQDEAIKPIHPHYKNFRGTIEYISDQKYVSTGKVAILGSNKIEITELPIGTWTQTFKENVLTPYLDGNDKVKPILSDYKEYHTDTTVRFVLSFAPGEFDRLSREPGGFHKTFKLFTSINLSSMHAFDANHCLRKFDNVAEIFKEFYDLRLEYYGKRKKFMEGRLQAETSVLTNQARFILEKCNKTLTVENKKRKEMVEELISRGYDTDPMITWKESVAYCDDDPTEGLPAEESDNEDEESTSKKPKKPLDAEATFNKNKDVKKFNYLLGMALWYLTEERKNQLIKNRDMKIAELEALRATPLKTLWMNDLAVLEAKLDEVEEKERKIEAGVIDKNLKGADKKRVMANQKQLSKDCQPTKNAEEVKFIITNEIMKKFESAANAKVNAKVKKEKAGAGATSIVELDEFDLMVEGSEETTKRLATATAVTAADGDSPGDSDKPAAAAVTSKAAPKARTPAATKVKREPKAPAAKKKDDLKQTKLNFGAKKATSKTSSISGDDNNSSGGKKKAGRRSMVISFMSFCSVVVSITRFF